MEKIEHTSVTTNGINVHVASLGSGPVVLFLHGFPELWYSWRHQLLHISSRGYRAIAPDLRGYGDTEAPAAVTSYTVFQIVGDLVGVLDKMGIEKVYLVGHDWGAGIAWSFCMYRPDRVKALVSLCVPFISRNPDIKPVDAFRAMYGDDHYICRFQEPGEIEEDFAQIDTATFMKKMFKFGNTVPPLIPKETGFRGLPVPPLPSWISEEELNYYASKFNQTGLTGGLNYYRCMNLNWELEAPWSGIQIKVPVKFVVGDLDLTYHIPGMKEYIHSGEFKKDVPLLHEVVVMEGVGHFINQEKPEEVSEHIYDFIKKF